MYVRPSFRIVVISPAPCELFLHLNIAWKALDCVTAQAYSRRAGQAKAYHKAWPGLSLFLAGTEPVLFGELH